MKLNTNSNTYTILYACGVVIVVAFLLAFVSSALKEPSEANERIDKKKQILAALNIEPSANVEAQYEEVVKQAVIVDTTGNIVKMEGGFEVAQKDITPTNLPVYICQVGKDKKYVLPLVGKGLWGTIWGYLAVNDDCHTIYGVYFSHASETAGLGAIIKEKSFQEQFKGKVVRDTTTNRYLTVTKYGKADKDSPVECDGISGATLTCDGVTAMLHSYLQMYNNYLTKKK